MWAPNNSIRHDLLATCNQYVRIWQVEEGSAQKLWDVKSAQSKQTGPLTCFDWNQDRPNILATASIDNICTVWDLEHMTVVQQLIAHESSVNSITFANEDAKFATGGDDGSVRVFDMRNLNYSTIIYEARNPILHVLWNRDLPMQLALVTKNDNRVIILDVR